MKVLGAFALLFLLLVPPSEARTIRQIQLRGNARILSADAPVRRGRLYLFHRYPDSVYMSVAAEDVLGIASMTVDERATPGDTVLLGPTGEGRTAEAAGAASSVPVPVSYSEGYPGYYGGCYGCYVPKLPPRPPVAPPPALVGPNGFPLVPGSPPPPPIGPNGFPILDSPPARPSPR
ncbi:MAG: hypothetical protein ACRD3M_05290 [Thermoanaerobaculia bacterium]